MNEGVQQATTAIDVSLHCEEKTVFAGHFALSTEIRCYNSGSIPVSIPIFESGFQVNYKYTL